MQPNISNTNTLNFGFEPSVEPVDYVVSKSNQEVWRTLFDKGDWPQNRLVLFGPKGAGKTHLINIWVKENEGIVYDSQSFPHELNADMEGNKSIAVDNFELLIGNKSQERVLLQLCNSVAQSQSRLLLTTAQNPKTLSFAFPDFKSRIVSSLISFIPQPDTELLTKLYFKLFSDKRIQIDKTIVKFLVENAERSFEAVEKIVNKLDTHSLIQQKQLTRKLASEVIESLSLKYNAKSARKKGHRAVNSRADFLNSNFPEPVVYPNKINQSSQRFFNRELSWLNFNWRVLEEAKNPQVPLMERIRFVSISATNFEEFYTVRVAGLMELVARGDFPPGNDGRLPSEQLIEIERESQKLLSDQLEVWNSLQREMETHKILILKKENLNKRDQDYLDQQFIETVFPVLTPLAVDPAHPFPFIPNAGFTIALKLEHEEDKRNLRALLPIPVQINRFVKLPNGPKDQERFIPLEELLLEKVHFIFPGYSVSDHCIFRVLRDSDLEFEEEAEDLVREFETALKRRRRGKVIHVSMNADSDGDINKLVLAELNFEPERVTRINGMIGLADLSELVKGHRHDLLWPKFTPRIPERVKEHNDDIFAAVRSKDMLLHHPYETFDMVIRFLRQASIDPNVVAIKQTLYRTSYESPIVDALCEAAENGKSVTALVELKARFDEATNIRQSRKLERSGAHVVYGFINLKTHAKVSSVIRREGNSMVTYTHFGTGNYHPITAKIYTDLSFFTCDAAIGRDGTKLINFVSGYAVPDKLECVSIAPFNLRKTLLNCIENESRNAKKGKPAEIWAKLNSLIDPEVIDALYQASQANVKISLIVRGICGLRPGIKGLSENIRVKSIVGRFLEHSRILCLGNGNFIPSGEARVFLSSADWMERNLDRRVETLVEINNPTVREQIMSQVMAANLADSDQSWVLQPDGSYLRASLNTTEDTFNCHQFFMDNPSLSGRGSAGAKEGIRLVNFLKE